MLKWKKAKTKQQARRGLLFGRIDVIKQDHKR